MDRDEWQARASADLSWWREYLLTSGGGGGVVSSDAFSEPFDECPALQTELNTVHSCASGSFVRLLNVEAGPATWVGKRSPRCRLDITLLDALAGEHAVLLEQAELAPPIATRQFDAEWLDVDLLWCCILAKCSGPHVLASTDGRGHLGCHSHRRCGGALAC
jgi:hypothetical protein